MQDKSRIRISKTRSRNQKPSIKIKKPIFTKLNNEILSNGEGYNHINIEQVDLKCKITCEI